MNLDSTMVIDMRMELKKHTGHDTFSIISPKCLNEIKYKSSLSLTLTLLLKTMFIENETGLNVDHTLSKIWCCPNKIIWAQAVSESFDFEYNDRRSKCKKKPENTIDSKLACQIKIGTVKSGSVVQIHLAESVFRKRYFPALFCFQEFKKVSKQVPRKV